MAASSLLPSRFQSPPVLKVMTQDVIKPFCAVPALKLSKDRAWAPPSLFCWAQPGARNWEGAHKLMDGSSLLCYPHSCQHFQKLPQILPHHQPCVTDPAGGNYRELVGPAPNQKTSLSAGAESHRGLTQGLEHSRCSSICLREKRGCFCFWMVFPKQNSLCSHATQLAASCLIHSQP